MKTATRYLLAILLTLLLTPAVEAARAYCWSLVIDGCETESHCDHYDDEGNFLGTTHVYYEC